MTPPNRKLMVNGVEVVCANRGETDFVYREIFDRNAYLRHGVTLSSDAIVMDVGANIGLFAIYLSNRFPGIHVHAYEPSPEVASLLSQNCVAHGVRGSVNQVAISNHDGRAELTCYPNMTLMSGLDADRAADEAVTRRYIENVMPEAARYADALVRGKFESVQVEVICRRTSSAIDDLGVDHVDLLKIDVEKGEERVLGGVEDRHWPVIRQLVVEVHDIDGRLVRVVNGLELRGFQVSVEQEAEMAGTNIHMAYATR